jgi:ribosomal RNA assembly protein
MPETPEYAYELKIPKERIAVLIGAKGETRKRIEDITHAKLDIDSDEGDVRIGGHDALGLFTAREIVRAIARGFNPELALQLTKQDMGFEIIPLASHAKNQDDMTRLKGRVIGEGGKSRRVIEELTGCDISVYGKTVAIIGPIEAVPACRRAIEALLSGQAHASVYHWLERKAKELHRTQLLGHQQPEGN